MKKKKTRKEHELKDDILTAMSKSDVVSSLEVAETLKITNETVIQYTNDIIKDNYIVAVTHSDVDRQDYNGRVTPKGHAFLKDGGYTGSYKKGRRKRRWETWFKFVTVMLFPAVAIGISVWQGILTNKTNKLEDKNERLQQQVDSLIKHPTIQKLYFPTDALKQRDSVPR